MRAPSNFAILLAATAARLRQSLRSYDFVGRIGGDEFVLLLPRYRGRAWRVIAPTALAPVGTLALHG